jgi:hypothetical protein
MANGKQPKADDRSGPQRKPAKSRWALQKGTMALCLSKLSTPIPGCLLRKGPRVFALLGKATPLGLAAFGREDLSRSWALTAELGCLRLERLDGDEEVTGQQLFLPLPADYNYGITGADKPAETARATGQRVAAGQLPGPRFLAAGPAVQPDLLHHPGVLAPHSDLEPGAAWQRGIAGDIHTGARGLAAAGPAQRAVSRAPTGV